MNIEFYKKDIDINDYQDIIKRFKVSFCENVVNQKRVLQK